MDKFCVMIIFVCIVEMGSLLVVVECFGMLLILVVCSLVVFEGEFGVCLLNWIMWCMVLIDEGWEYFECCWWLLLEVEEVEVVLLVC